MPAKNGGKEQLQERSGYGSGLHDGIELRAGVWKDGVVFFNISLIGSCVLFEGNKSNILLAKRFPINCLLIF